MTFTANNPYKTLYTDTFDVNSHYFCDMEPNDKIVIYQTDDGQMRIDVRMENETVWLSANQMAALFDRDEKTIRKHINNVFNKGELLNENNTHFLRVDKVKQPLYLKT